MKEREKYIEEWIYPKGRKRIPQESLRIIGGEPWLLGNRPWVTRVDLRNK
jgi:hypothetical protein